MDPALTVGGYVAVGLTVTSMLHTWYASHVYDGLSFGLLFSERFRTSRPVADGYRGSFALGAVAFVTVAGYVHVGLPMESLTVGILLRAKLPEVVVGAAILGVCSQVIAGASWSKFVLDGALLFMAFNLLVSFVQPPSFWNLFTVYATIIPPLGGAWSVWRDAFVQRRVAEGEEDALLYPHFPSFGYFAGSASVTLVGSLFLIVQNVQ